MSKSGRGGVRPGQGVDPLYGEAMKKPTIRLSSAHHAWLKQHGPHFLRQLIEWAGEDDNKYELVEDPGIAAEKRTTVALTDRHTGIAELLGGGVGLYGTRMSGIRRIIETAIQKGWTPQNFDSTGDLAAKAP